ncbi:sigma-54-dependent transcriptional regulator, partial [Escherichia coli]
MSSDTPISTQAQVVLIDDDPHLRQALSQTLDLAGLKVASLGDARDLAARLPADWQGVVVSDIRMPGIDGLELLQQLRARDSELPVILITGHGDIQLAVQAMRAGAYDFLEKPFPSEALLDSVRRALALRQLVLDNRSLRLALADRQQLSARLLGQSRAMLRLREQIGALAGTQADVLILGETGAGKEVVARALHDLSNRRNGPFVAINAGALAESVVESELFGHEPGAFTGAQKRRIGKFEFANGGTLFLDEIESMSLDVQVKLL